MPSSVRIATALLLTLASVAGCASGSRVRPNRPDEATASLPEPLRNPQTLTFDATRLYQQMGLVAHGLPLPFIGSVSYLGSPSPDTTHVVVALSFSNAAFAFAREADARFRANYTVGLTLRRESSVVVQKEAHEKIFVGSYRETARTEESVIFQEILDVPPGQYVLTVAVRDEGSARISQEELIVRIPRLDAGSLATPIAVAEVTPRIARDSIPSLLVSPRATVVFGRDSIIPIYLEGYGELAGPLQLMVRNSAGKTLWSDTASVSRRGAMAAGIVRVPVSRVGIGVSQVAFTQPGRSDTVSTPVFVGFGDDLPVATFDDMLSYLRYYVAPFRLKTLRDTTETERPAAWAAFVRGTDPDTSTSVHEGLRDYFGRLARANGRFREEGMPGWLTDRGKVLVALGEPDQILEPQSAQFQRGRQQIWEYRGANLQLVFFDQSGVGRWLLTQSSETQFEAEWRRRVR